jgi:hypothetical protein
MPTFAMLGADLPQCTWRGRGGGPERAGKTSKPELLFLWGYLSGAQRKKSNKLILSKDSFNQANILNFSIFLH